MGSMTETTPLLRRVLLGIVAATFLISCSTGGGKDATKLSKAELRKALPNATQVGAGYKVDSSNSDNSSDPKSDAAFAKACPEVKELGLNNKKDDKKDIKADFIAKDGRSITTSFDLTPKNLEKNKLDTVIGAINKCDTVRYASADGTKVEIDLSAKRDDSHGDAGLRFKLQARGDVQGKKFSVDSEGLIFTLDGIGVQVMTQGSVDQTDLSSIPPDTGKIDDLAKTMVDGVHSAEG
jgi:hypothetical protein